MKHYSSLVFDYYPKEENRIALIDQNGLRRTSWGELREHCRRVAAYARRKKLTGVIPVCMERSAEAVAAILGLNMGGVGVAPLSADTPAERVRLIEKETGNVVFRAEDYQAAMQTEEEAPAPLTAPFDPALVIFTSGSTGIPKGVMLSNDAVEKAVIRASERLFQYSREDVALQNASFSFVAIIIDLLAPLYAGATVHILPEAARKDAALMTKYITKNAVTAMFAAPKILHLLGDMPSMRTVIVGGERLNRFATADYRLVNVYGMSETVAEAFCFAVDQPYENTPIGTPDPDFTCYLVDENGQLADEGEICVSGAIASGYYMHPELTEQVFTENPFSQAPGHEVLLHSGDIAKRLPDGTYLFINRKDFMIKINGQRVEPGEIETVMKHVFTLKDAAVIGYTEENGRTYLCAYYIAEQELDIEKARRKMAESLPAYMIPAYWVRMDRFPLNANGKLDRKALLPPHTDAVQKEYTAPVGEVETLLCQAFQKVLQLDRIGSEDDFILLGGDSIRAMEVSHTVKAFRVTASDILLGRTPRAIARFAAKKEDDALLAEEAPLARTLLTNSQIGIYLQCIHNPDCTMYNLPVRLTYAREAGMTAASVKQAIDTVIERHSALYAHLKIEDEEIYMCRKAFPLDGICTVKEAVCLPSAGEERAFVRTFDLFAGPLCRAQAYLTADQVVLYFDSHHIVNDGTSLSWLTQQFGDALTGKAVSGETWDAFSVYAIEHAEQTEARNNEAKQYFEALLAGNEIQSKPIYDTKPSDEASRQADKAECTLSLSHLGTYLRRHLLTESSFFMGVFGYTVAKMAGTNESLFATVESGRKNAHLATTVSMFVRTVPVLYRLDETKPASDFLQEGQTQFFHTLEHDGYPFGKLAGEYNVGADVMFAYEGDILASSDRVEVFRIPAEESFADFAVSVWKRGDSFLVSAEYRKACYRRETAERFLRLFETAANAFVQDCLLKDIPLLSDADRILLDKRNQTESAYEKDCTVADLFRRCATQYADKTALVCGDRRFTYREVDRLTDRIAAYIHKQGVGKGETVSVLVPRCEYMLLASLGVIKAGAIYQPLDPSYPPERLAFMCEDADSKLLIADRSLLPLLPQYPNPILCTDACEALPEDTYDGCPTPQDGFVLLYTSGTTGLPKGCRLLHRNVMAYVHAYDELFDVDDTYVGAAYASYGFDAHLSELYPPITAGGVLHIVRDAIRLDLPALKAYFEENGITHTVMTTQIARQFVNEYPSVHSLRYILCGGEKLATVTPPATYTLVNGYGPTEATVMITCFKLDGVYEDIPIGKALPNTKLYVQDAYGRRVPVGVPGELVVFGPQVADGYIKRPEKTAEVFISNSFDENASEDNRNGYKTGDIVRILEDGTLQIFGRRDSQVKIRGFRIELSEVESVIREYPDVRDATVIAVDDPAGGKCIYAYVVGNRPIDTRALHAFIREKKPPYMVPKATMQIDAIPLTPNLKVDKRKLPPMAVDTTDANVNAPVRPKTELEERLVKIVSAIVGHDRFEVETDFVSAGITSITSIRLAVQLYKEFGLHIQSKDILEGGSILSVENAIVSAFLEKKEKTEDKAEPRQNAYPLTQAQWGVYTDSLSRGMDTYLIPLLLELRDNLSTEKLKEAICTAVLAHPSMLCTVSAEEDGTPMVHPMPTLPIHVEEVTVQDPNVEPTHFTFGDAPLFRFRILNCPKKRYLLAEVHHILADGESLQILLRDIAAAYEKTALQTETFTVFDLAREEKQAREGKDFEVAKAYYDSIFRGMSADYLPCPDRFDACTFGTAEKALPVGKADIGAFCAAIGVSESVFFCSAFALTLARFTSHTDALFATVHNGRGDPRTENLFAMTVKTVPLYIETNGESTVGQFLHSLDERLKKLKKYDLFSFADAARKYGLSADLLFVYQGKLMQSTPLGVLQTTETDAKPKAALCVEVSEKETGFTLRAEYNAGRYSSVWMEGFLDSLAVCVSEFMQKPALRDVSICSSRGLAEFANFNDTDWPIEKQPAYRLFEKSVDRHPEKTAVVAGEERLTYRELDCMANELARRICAIGLPPESTAVLLFDRTKEIYVAQLGTLKSGNAFLCVSSAYPDERMDFILEDASAGVLITTHAVAANKKEWLAHLDIPILYADEISRQTTSARLHLSVDPEALAYMIYTSGSTGKPKGVTVQQKGLVTIADNNPKNGCHLRYHSEDAVSTAVSAFTFDASIMEGFVALANGVTVCIASEEQIHNPEAFCRYCLQNHVNSVFGTPSYLMNLSDYEGFGAVAKQLHTVMAGGEEFTAVLLNRLLGMNPGLCIINGYGPSEATVTCSGIQLKANERITIGTPIANTKLYCLDAYNHILPMGALGELTIVGDGVGKGYLHREDLTQKAFLTMQGKAAFKTGDLAVITHEGTVEFHGRLDNQVKIRGLRVELGEIEAVMQTLDGMKMAVVLVKGSGENKYLAAYFTAKRRIENREIVAEISKKLAPYMIPRNFLQLDEMPITANGKIDKKALPEIQVQRETSAPSRVLSATEKTVCELFASILKIREVLPDENFFEIGGNSLSASRAVMLLKSKGYTLEYQTLFDYQTPGALAAYLDRTRAKEKAQKDVSFAAGDPTSAAYRELLQYNALPYADQVKRTPLGEVVLTGAVGFLGVHVLRDLLVHEEGRIYCLVRKGSFSQAEERLSAIYYYYFGECLQEKYPKRVTVLDADITSENLSAVFRDIPFSTVINCAASVKHYAADDSIEYVNVHGVENLIVLARAKNARLIQISTTSVPGVHTQESLQNGIVLHENQLFMADDMNNKYIISKYHAEQSMLHAIRDGLRGKIIRVGNLMGRYADGEFQINMGSNAFLNALKGFAKIGKSPIGHCTDPMEFSPVDCTARAIVALAGTNDTFTLFHANSRYSFDEMQLMDACNRCGIPIIPVDDPAYYAEYTRMLGDPSVNKYLSALLTNDRPDIHAIAVDNRFTANVLYRIGFSWPFIDNSYLEKVITHLRDMGFFEREPS